jgi:predicted aspartyl protease
MPHFTIAVDANGPIVNAGVSVSEGRRAALVAQNQPVPAMRIIRALIDTGASFTAIEPQVLQALNLTPTGTIEIVTPSTGDGVHTTDTYDIDFTIGGADASEIPLLIPNLRVSSSELFLKQGIHALIGRDILKRCILVYNGSINHISLCF